MTPDERLLPLLKKHFGYEAFRSLQREIMEATLGQRDTLAILPTGAGKSLCYQLPALARDGVTLVISPLIALMKDQVDQLTAAGVAATFLNSTLAPEEARQRLEEIRSGLCKLVYLAPERLMSGDFLATVRTWNVTALAIDEAHCISEWGHDFRPEYRRLKELRQALPDVPVIALTATATPQVREDILTQLALRDPAVFLASFNRPNLNYLVEPKQDAIARIVAFVRSRNDESGIIYAQSRKRSEELAASLRDAGIAAACYHAGLDGPLRARNQEAFLRDEIRVICATVAFGMGINKPDVRFVIHADLPKNLEGYYQETGRAGRDGLPSDCLLLFSRGDVVKHLRFLNEISDEEVRANAHHQLETMADFAESDGCRRTGLLGYFGEPWTTENCGACDNCLAPRETWDATVEAQKLLSYILRVKQAGGPPVGIRHLAEILAGSRAEKVLARNHDKLSTYGIGKEHSATRWMEIARQLTRKGCLHIGSGTFPTVSVSNEGMNSLRERETFTLSRLMETEKPATRRAGDIECDPGLLEVLRDHRKQVATVRDLPPYVIFSDVTLRHMARSYPVDEASFLKIPGVGERKLADYATGFLREIVTWLSNHPRLPFTPLDSTPTPANRPVTNGTSKISLELWREGKSISEVAALRQLAESTIEGHLAQAIEAGAELDPNRLFTREEENEMRAAFDGYDDPSLKPVFEHLGGRISYGKLKLFRAIDTKRSVVAV